MSRADCDVCDEYRSKERRDLWTYKEASEAANRIIESQLKQIAILKAALRKDRFFRVWANTKNGSASVNTITKIADRQLAKEYPEINWEE